MGFVGALHSLRSFGAAYLGRWAPAFVWVDRLLLADFSHRIRV